MSRPYAKAKRQDTRRSHRSMEQTEGETHLSPRLTLRDISRGTCSFTRSSRRAEGDTRSTSRGIAIGSDPESWREQEKFEEKPLEMNRSSATRFSRNMRLWVADNKSKGKPHISYQQRKRWESRESNIREQMQFEQVSPSLSAFRCASPTRQEEPDETHFKSKQQGEEKRPSLVTFECKERHSFQVANLQDVFQHVQYEKPSNEQADKHDLTTKEVVRFDDERMKDKFSVFPLRQTMTMLRSSPYLLKKEVGILSSHSPSSPSRSAQRNIRYPDSLLPEAQPAAWNSSLRVADTTGLIGEEEQQQLHVTFTCQTRREFPFSFANGRTDPKASHTFTDLIRLGASTPTPSSVSREAQAQGVQRGGSPTAPGSPGFKTWQNEVKREYHESEMFSAMSSQSTSGFRIARRTDRKSWDGGSANSRAPEEEEVGKPMVRTPEVTKTRQHVHEDLNLNPSFSAPRPTWVCLERHKQHAH
ncbi:hypothetical protein GUITHDRAFT_122354 [Guillardia theta CCMP2712]|uniref:Uncharacterized protein n=1 Tax=Guillardia theta (strain CCMP2712) TaxID=905079 RepID=L1I5B5_GUITC|nr:hypothetical protein GUITHDRAFT_122354 [Guillardia theta CCMP2712]EKX31458.1 hypothetical protein GUITHDRAFT_122354 [Guillardia theta CCMP2712]|eukprot:XP_005818438.1 hypothetical protein GUITHDRAFT_122354 [Guillardia theta CCMP2712]